MTRNHQKTVLIRDTNASWYADELQRLCPNYRYLTATDHDTTLAQAPEAEIIIGHAPYLTEPIIAAAAKLEWIQSLTSGVDSLLAMPALDPAVALTNCGGLHGPQMSELVFLMMLNLNRNYPTMLANQQTRKWERWPQPLLLNKTITIAGIGRVAEELAQRCNAFGMTVVGVSDGRSEVAGFDRIYKRKDLHAAAAECDFLVCLMPYDASSHHIIDASVFAAMPSSATFISMSRGDCVDEDALKEALRNGQIAAAGLDVFANEPLRPDDPIWSTPNVLITPHIGGMSDVFRQQVLPRLATNLTAFAADKTARLQGLVTRKTP